MNQIKINNVVYFYKSLSYQPTIGTHGTIYASFDIKFKTELLKIYDEKKYFTLVLPKLRSDCCKISFVDINNTKGLLNIKIKSDIFIEIDIKERREEILSKILK